MFKITNKPALYKLLVSNIETKDTKEIYKNTISLLKKERLFRNTEKLEKYLKEKINFKENPSTFLFNLSSSIFEFSRKLE